MDTAVQLTVQWSRQFSIKMDASNDISRHTACNQESIMRRKKHKYGLICGQKKDFEVFGFQG